jgi:hypothetical protein
LAALTIIWIWGLGASEARAYVDPGTGSALFSSLAIVLGVASTGIVVCFQQVKRFIWWLTGKFNHGTPSPDLSEQSDNA